MLAAMVGSRDRESFRRVTGYTKTPPRTRTKGARAPRLPPRMLPAGVLVRSVHDTVNDVMVDDALHMALASRDPLEACRRISSGIRGWH